MSFSNYGHPFLSIPFFCNGGFYPYPCYGYGIPSSSRPAQQEATVNFQVQIRTQNTFKEFDKQKLIQNLKKFHYESVHHKKTHWTFQEDKLLQSHVEIQKLEWRQIPKFFKERTQNMCYSRYRRISMSTKDRNWSKEQEELVIDLINSFGERWKLLSSKMPKFTPKQIRERYLNYLRPNIIKDDFTYEQDLKICQYVLEHGKHWRKMQELLQGRPEGTIKGRYYGKLQNIIEESYSQLTN